MQTMKEKLSNNKIIAAICGAVLVISLIVGLTIIYIYANQDKREVIADSVEFAGKTYTADKPLKVLEIAPDESLSEIGYMSGVNGGAVTWEDICALPARTDEQKKEKAAIRQAWVKCYTSTIQGNRVIQLRKKNATTWETLYGDANSTISSFSDEDYYTADIRVAYSNADTDWKYVGLEADASNGEIVNWDNFFAYNMFDSCDMEDKMNVTIKSAKNVTPDDIDQYDMVYVSNGAHIGNGQDNLNVYQKMYEYVNKYEIVNLNHEYHDVTGLKTGISKQNGYLLNNIDLTAEATWKIYDAYSKKNISLIIDKNVGYDGDTLNNVEKLFILAAGVDRDTFVTEFCANYDSATGVYSGTKGRIYVETVDGVSTLRISYLKDSVYQEMMWNDRMFIKAFTVDQNTAGYPYYSPTNHDLFVNENFMIYNGNNTVGVAYGSDSGALSYVDGSTMQEMVALYGNPDNKTIKNSFMLKYILGGYRENKFTSLNVLEIDPIGLYKYSSSNKEEGFEMAKKILKYFGKTFDGMNANNYTDYVKVKSISSNGFIALQDDLKTTYDLIIVSDYNDPTVGLRTENTYYNSELGKEVPFLSGVYASQGEMLKLDVIKGEVATTFSGNDFTEKALSKLIDYVNTGKPMVIASSIYDNTDETPACNVYKLSKKQLATLVDEKYKKLSNVISEWDDGETLHTERLSYKITPEFKIPEGSKLSCTHKDGIVDTSEEHVYTSKDLESFQFEGIIDRTYGLADQYYLEFSVDKDGNGLFTNQGENQDDFEVVYRGAITVNADGTFSTSIQIPPGIRGYVRWKAVLSTDESFHLSKSVEDAFVVRYEKYQDINLLQVTPDDNVTFTMGSGSEFMKQFNRIKDIIGVNLNVEVVNKKRFSSMSRSELDNYKMIVIGFADDFNNEDMSESAAKMLLDYANAGNAVLFSHDTITFSAYSDSTGANQEYGKSPLEDYKAAFNITKQFRYLVGMDRYGISLENSEKGTMQQGFTNMYLMRWAQLLNVPIPSRIDENSLTRKYAIYEELDDEAVESKIITTDAVKKLNMGQVTEYPFQIADKISVAETHAQWFQLDLESKNKGLKEDGSKDYSDSADDAVVWYTLAESDTKENQLGIGDSVLEGHGAQWTSKNESYPYISSTYGGKSNNVTLTNRIPTDGAYIKFIPSCSGKVYFTLYGDTTSASKVKKIKYHLIEVSVDENGNETYVGEETKDSRTSNKSIVFDYTIKEGHRYYLYGEGTNLSRLICISKVVFRRNLDGDYDDDAPNASYLSQDSYVRWTDILEHMLYTSASNIDSNDRPDQVVDKYITSKYYTLAGQDALNNYYIYSKGNITYSGAGHSSVTGTDEIRLFVNTVVKALASGNNKPEIAVENAVDLGSNSFEQYIRPAETPTITFTPSDIDMGVVEGGAFASGRIYWDVDNDGAYNENVDVLLKNYQQGELRNLSKADYQLTDSDLKRMSSNGLTLENELNKNQLHIGISVTDISKKADQVGQTGSASLHLICRALFQLN